MAWQLIQQNGLEGVNHEQLETLIVPDYSGQEKHEDEQAVDWEMAFNELEFGEMAKQDRIARERDEEQKKILEQQKALFMQQIKSSEQKHEQERRDAEQRQKEE